MIINETGLSDGKTILLLPGTCCNAEVNFGNVLPLLEKEYHVIAVNYDGFDGTNSEFDSMISQTEKIENYILQNHNGQIDIAYGSSLGGSFVGLLMQRKRIHMTHGILGSSDLDQNGKISGFITTQIFGALFYNTLKKGNLPEWMWKMMEKKKGKDAVQDFRPMIEGIGKSMQTVTKSSMKNEFYSDLITPLDDKIQVTGTTLHVFYALQMGSEYRARYEKHFANPDIIEQNYAHEVLLFSHPEEWISELKKCTNH